MIIIEIDNESVKEKTGTKDGKPWTMRVQQVVIHGYYVDGFPSRYPRESTIEISQSQPPFPVGKYVIAPDSFFFADFGRFKLGRVQLQPIGQFLAELQATFKLSSVSAKAA